MIAARINVHSVLGIEALTGADYRLSLSLQMTDGQRRETAAQLLGEMQTDKLAEFLRAEFAELFDDAPVAQPAGEPVAWMYTLEYGPTVADRKVSQHQLNYPFGVCGADYLHRNADGVSYVRQMPLYTAPPAAARVPLTRDRILELAEPFGAFEYGDAQGDARIAFARAIEAAGLEGGAA